MKEKIYLETDDEITSVIDKIKKKTSENIEVVVPKGATLIQSIVNLKLLNRQSSLMKKNLSLIINDDLGINLAKKAGLQVHSNIKKDDLNQIVEPKQKIIERIIPDKNKHSEEAVNDSTIENIGEDKKLTEKPQKPEARKNIFQGITRNIKNIENRETKKTLDKSKNDPQKEVNKFFKLKSNNKVHMIPSVNLKSFLFFFGISIVVIMLIFVMILPSAKVNIHPKIEPFTTSFDIIISNNAVELDQEKLIFPGEIITHEAKSERKKFNATGEKQVGEKARGEIIVYNSYSSDPINLISSTRFSTLGKIFYSLHEITIPGASIEGGVAVPGKTRVRVEAESEGEDYNINPSRFIIPNLSNERQQDIYGESANSFAGGSSKIIKVVSEQDYENAKNQLLEGTFDDLVDSLLKKISSDKMLAVGIMKKEITEINSNPGIDEESEEFELDMKVKAIGYLVNNNDIEFIINNKFKQFVPEEKFVIGDDIIEGVEFEPIEGIISDESSIAAKINITKKVAWKLDDNRIKDNIRGTTVDEAKSYILKEVNINDATVNLWPFWVKKVPKNTKKIKISLDTDNISDKIIDN
jgi:hypothetical protein